MQVLFEPTEKQSQFIQTALSGKYRFILFGGSVRGGKTYAGLGAIITLCKLYPGSRWAVVRDSLTTLKRNTIPSFDKICPSNFISTYNQETQTVTFTNGSQILFFAENFDDDKELNRWRGLEVNGFLLEECNELTEEAFYKAMERSGTYIPLKGTKPKPIILLTCNPANNWVKELFYKKWQEGTLPKDYLYIPSKITDNPYIMADKDYVESLKNLPRYQYEVFVNGDWDIQLKTGGEFYKCFELDKHVSQCKYNDKLPLHISFDENVNPFLGCAIFQIEGMELRMIDEIAGRTPNNTVNAVCSEIKRKYRGHQSGMFIYGDATSQKEDTKQEKGHNFFYLIREQLREFQPQLRVDKANPSVVMRGSFINSILEKEINGIKVLIDENCKHMITDFINLKEAADGTKNKEMATDPKTKVRYQKFGHMGDAFDYIIVRAFYNEWSMYQRGGGKSFGYKMGKNTSNNSWDGQSTVYRRQSKHDY